MRVEGRTALSWRPGHRTPFHSLEGQRQPPLKFGPACIDIQALIAGGAGAERRVRPRVYSFDNARVIMGSGDDGAVITEDDHLVSELSVFSQIGQRPTPFVFERAVHPNVIDEAVIGIDGAFHNYYHWLINALARSRLCSDAIKAGPPVLLPDLTELPDLPGRVRPTTVQSSFEAFLGSRRCLLLAPGVHHVRRLHVLWTRPTSPTDIAGVRELYDIFDDISRRLLPRRPFLRKRLFFSRKGAYDERIPAAEREKLAALLERRRFTVLDLADMSFEAQVRAAAAADMIVSPHGAGMANLLFSPRKAKVIELTSRLGQEATYRPWYYQLCDGRGQPYSAIDVGRPGWLEDLARAIS